MLNNKIVYGVGCVWWDSINQAGKKTNGLPCCPHCGSVLMESSQDQWNKNVVAYEQNGNKGYSKFILWLQGKCFKTMTEAMKEYEKSN